MWKRRLTARHAKRVKRDRALCNVWQGFSESCAFNLELTLHRDCVARQLQIASIAEHQDTITVDRSLLAVRDKDGFLPA